jgi:hypothetical protein
MGKNYKKRVVEHSSMKALIIICVAIATLSVLASWLSDIIS